MELFSWKEPLAWQITSPFNLGGFMKIKTTILLYKTIFIFLLFIFIQNNFNGTAVDFSGIPHTSAE